MKYQFKEYHKSQIKRGHLHMGGSNPSGGTIEVNSLYFERNKKPWIGAMGEYHFSRDKRENWHTELCKMKAGGINVISTYLFWNYHEEEEGIFDFSGNHDIRAFIEECKSLDLDFVLRFGPWSHGEARNGGFPDWLNGKAYALRDKNEGFMNQVKTYWTKIYEQVDGVFYDQGGNIIAIQIENECVDNADYIAALKELALEIGFRAPIYTATGWNRQDGARLPLEEVVPVFGGYVEYPWEPHTDRLPPSMHFFFQPMRNEGAVGADLKEITEYDDSLIPPVGRLPYEDYPFATCEMGGGIENTHHRRSVIDPFDVYAASLVKLGCGNNLIGYYMYHGGQHKLGKFHALNEDKQCGYPNDYPTLSYDFQAPISEFGEIREHYRLFNLLNLFVADFGEVLAPMEYVAAKEAADRADCTRLRYSMRTDGKSGFVFVNHHQRHTPIADIRDVVIDTGSVVFPPIDVCGKVCFFMPFHMECGTEVLKTATAQPLCRVDHTYYFVEIPGVKACFEFEDGKVVEPHAGKTDGFQKGRTTFILLTWNQARFARKLNGKLCLGDEQDLYVDGHEVKRISLAKTVKLEREACEAPFEVNYDYELKIGGMRKLSWYKIRVAEEEGFVEIPDVCDAAQVYADKELVADEFYHGSVWRLPAKLFYGKQAYLVTSEIKDDFYREF